MSHQDLLSLGSSRPLQQARLSLSRSGRLEIQDAGGSRSIHLPLEPDECMAVIDMGDWVCLAPSRAGFVVVGAMNREAPLSMIHCLPRLALSGYDPGGLERVGLVPWSGGVVVETEVGAVMVLPEPRVAWQVRHDDLTMRLSGYSEELLEFRGDSGVLRLSFRPAEAPVTES